MPILDCCWVYSAYSVFLCVFSFFFRSSFLLISLSLSLSFFPALFLTSICWSTYFYERNVLLRYILGKTVRNKTTWIENNNCTVKFMFSFRPPFNNSPFIGGNFTVQWFPFILTGLSYKSRFSCNEGPVLGRFHCTYVHNCVYVCVCACASIHVCEYIQSVPGGKCQTSGRCSLC